MHVSGMPGLETRKESRVKSIQTRVRVTVTADPCCTAVGAGNRAGDLECRFQRQLSTLICQQSTPFNVNVSGRGELLCRM